MPFKGFFKTLNFIYTHPLNCKRRLGAIVRFLKWQISTRLTPHPVVVPFATQSKFLMWRGLTGATQNLYCGLQEFEDMAFVLHFLRAEDQFIDIGANVGSYTLLAASEVGASTLSVEPIPSTFEHLSTNIALNNAATKVQALNIGLGKEEAVLHFTKDLDTTNHVAKKEGKDTIAVQVKALDEVVKLKQDTLLKMDVEGFETEVLKGMTNTLKNDHLKAIIIELNGSGNRYGYDENAIHQQLLDANFQPYYYFPFERKLEQRASYGEEFNTIYIKDIAFAQERVQTAKKVRIHEQEF